MSKSIKEKARQYALPMSVNVSRAYQEAVAEAYIAGYYQAAREAAQICEKVREEYLDKSAEIDGDEFNNRILAQAIGAKVCALRIRSLVEEDEKELT